MLTSCKGEEKSGKGDEKSGDKKTEETKGKDANAKKNATSEIDQIQTRLIDLGCEVAKIGRAHV